MKIKAVLYDMDGTLIDSEKLQKLAWTERAALRGVTIGKEFYRGAMGRNIRRVKELLTELYPNIGDTDTLYEEKEALYRGWMDERGIPVMPGAHRVLGELGVRGVKQCVCTSTSRHSAVPTLQKAGLYHKFDDIVCGDDITQSKPNPEIFLRGAEKLGVDISECAVIEDAPAGIMAGLASGAKVFIVPGLLPVEEELTSRCTCVQSLYELLDLLD